jgi:hypothetical protein
VWTPSHSNPADPKYRRRRLHRVYELGHCGCAEAEEYHLEASGCAGPAASSATACDGTVWRVCGSVRSLVTILCPRWVSRPYTLVIHGDDAGTVALSGVGPIAPNGVVPEQAFVLVMRTRGRCPSTQTWGDNPVSSCRSHRRAKGLGISAGAFPMALPYREMTEGVLDGVQRGPVGPPGPLESAAHGPDRRRRDHTEAPTAQIDRLRVHDRQGVVAVALA